MRLEINYRSVAGGEERVMRMENAIAEDIYQVTEIHPWHRKDPSVAVTMYYLVDGERLENEDHPMSIDILDRELFVAGLLQVFPELRRA